MELVKIEITSEEMAIICLALLKARVTCGEQADAAKGAGRKELHAALIMRQDDIRKTQSSFKQSMEIACVNPSQARDEYLDTVEGRLDKWADALV